MKNEDMHIGINPIILNDKNQILLGCRKQKFGEGTYCLPGGKLRLGETFEECVIREVKEETGLIIKEEDIAIINISNTIITETIHFVQIGVLVKKYEGIPEICEREKCSDLRFFDLNDLPTLFEPNRASIELFKRNMIYDKNLNIE
jgi:8-oxo-dGTP diphosphatase